MTKLRMRNQKLLVVGENAKFAAKIEKNMIYPFKIPKNP